jgi:hypothetical protein
MQDREPGLGEADRAGVGVGALRQRDGLSGGVLVGLGHPDDHVQAFGMEAQVGGVQGGGLAAAAHHGEPEHQGEPVPR